MREPLFLLKFHVNAVLCYSRYVAALSLARKECMCMAKRSETRILTYLIAHIFSKSSLHIPGWGVPGHNVCLSKARKSGACLGLPSYPDLRSRLPDNLVVSEIQSVGG